MTPQAGLRIARSVAGKRPTLGAVHCGPCSPLPRGPSAHRCSPTLLLYRSGLFCPGSGAHLHTAAPHRGLPFSSQRAGVESREEPGAQERGGLWVTPWGDPRPFHGVATSQEDLPELSPWTQGAALAHWLPSLLTQAGPPTTRLKGGGFLLLFFLKIHCSKQE